MKGDEILRTKKDGIYHTILNQRDDMDVFYKIQIV